MLGDNAIGDDGFRALVRSPALPALRDLGVTNNGITDDGLRVLMSSDQVAALDRLDLSGNPGITSAGITALAGSQRLRSLASLQLSGCRIGPGGAIAVARSPHAAALRDIDMRGCGIGVAGALAFAESPVLTNIQRLQISDNRIDDACRQRLRALRHPGELPRLSFPTSIHMVSRVAAHDRLRRRTSPAAPTNGLPVTHAIALAVCSPTSSAPISPGA